MPSKNDLVPVSRTDQVVVIVPTYNERDSLPELVAALRGLAHPNLQILVVDDNSPDGTGEVADALAADPAGDLGVLHRGSKDGLGRAYIAGMTQALRDGADVVIQMDSDLSHPVSAIPRMLEVLRTSDASVVVGSRYVAGGAVSEQWPRRRRALSRWANRYVDAVLRMGVRDATSGFKAWRAGTLELIDIRSIRSSGYSFQVEMTYRASRASLTVTEIPIRFEERSAGNSKMTLGVQVESALLPWRLLLRRGPITTGGPHRDRVGELVAP